MWQSTAVNERSITRSIFFRTGLGNDLFGRFSTLIQVMPKLGFGLFTHDVTEKNRYIEPLVSLKLRNAVLKELFLKWMEIEDTELRDANIFKLAGVCVVNGAEDFTSLNNNTSWHHLLLPSIDKYKELTQEDFLEFCTAFVISLENIFKLSDGSLRLNLSVLKIKVPEKFPAHLRNVFENPEVEFSKAFLFNDEIPIKLKLFHERSAEFWAANTAPHHQLFSGYDLAREIIKAKGLIKPGENVYDAVNSYIVMVAKKITNAGIYLLNNQAKELFLQWAIKNTDIIQGNDTRLQLPDFQEYYPLFMEELAIKLPAVEKGQQSPFQLAQEIVKLIKLNDQTKINFVHDLARIIYRAGIHHLSDENATKFIEKFSALTALETKEKYFVFDVNVITITCEEFLTSIGILPEKISPERSEESNSNGKGGKRSLISMGSSADRLVTASSRIGARNRTNSKAELVEELEHDSKYLRQRSKTDSSRHSSGETSSSSRNSSNDSLPVVSTMEVVTVNPTGPRRLMALRLFDTKNVPKPGVQLEIATTKKFLK